METKKEKATMALTFEQQAAAGGGRSLVKTPAKPGRSKVLMEKWSRKFDCL
jgi:hypothetical protein